MRQTELTARSQVALAQAAAGTMVLAVIAVTRTGTQEGLGTEEGTARGAPTAAPGAESSAGILQRHGADQLSSCQAMQTHSSRGSAPMGEVPLADPAAHPSQGRTSWKSFGELEHLRSRCLLLPKGAHSLWENTAVFQAWLLRLVWNWEQLGVFTRLQQQLQSRLL